MTGNKQACCTEDPSAIVGPLSAVHWHYTVIPGLLVVVQSQLIKPTQHNPHPNLPWHHHSWLGLKNNNSFHPHTHTCGQAPSYRPLQMAVWVKTWYYLLPYVQLYEDSMFRILRQSMHNHTCQHPHKFNELATKSEKCNGQHPPSKTPVGVLPWTCQSEGKWLSR